MLNLQDLLERWRRTPDPLLADLIDVVDTQQRQAPYIGTLTKQREAAYAAIQSREADALTSTLETLAAQRSVTQGVLMARELSNWPDDPRLTSQFRAMLEAPPWTSSKSQQVWRLLFIMLENSSDPRLLQWTEIDPEQGFPGQTSQYIQKRIDKLTRRHFPQSQGSEAERQTWQGRLDRHREEQDRKAQQRVEAERLGQAVLDSPDDLEVREIYADALIEQGDPRGLFVRLQLQGGKSNHRQAKKLLKEHQKTWLGPVDKVLLKGERVWEHGFLHSAVGRPKNKATVDAALDHPALRSLRSLELRHTPGQGYRGFELLAGPSTPNLKRVAGLVENPEMLEILRNIHEKPIECIETSSGVYRAPDGPHDLSEVRIRELRELRLNPAWTRWVAPLSHEMQVESMVFDHETGPSTFAYPGRIETTIDLIPTLDSGWAAQWRIEFLFDGRCFLEVQATAGGERCARVSWIPRPLNRVRWVTSITACLPTQGIHEVEADPSLIPDLEPVDGVHYVPSIQSGL